MFSQLADEYDRRYRLNDAHLHAIAELNMRNARSNPLAQTRGWSFGPEHVAIDHFGITEPGESWKAVENGELERDGAIPVNPSGGLIGVGHPVGATGVRMLHDAARQVTGQAGDCQVDGARAFATLNIGGSLTTTVSFVVTSE